MVAHLAETIRVGNFKFIDNASIDPNFPRMELAAEFGVKSIELILCEGGVLEYGVPAETQLNGNTMLATIKMMCDLTGALYSLYWVGVGGEYVVAGDYAAPDRRK